MGIQERAAFLSQMHLFCGLSEVQLQTAALQLTEQKIPVGTRILEQGGPNDRLFLIQAGQVRVMRHDKSGEKQLAILAAGDFFGEESLLQEKTPRLTACRVTAVAEVTAFILTRDVILGLAEQVSVLRTNILVAVQSQRLLRSVRFDWLQKDETIHYLARKHYILLVKAISWPVLLAITSIVGMFITWYVNKPALWWVALACLILAGGWGLWNAIDWSNDYYVVTNRRVVWLEKMIAIYDSRQEAPLSAVLRVNVQTDMLGRFLDYGDLIIRTIAGSTLTLKTANHPEQAAALIEDFWKRSQTASRRMEQEEMRKALQDRLIPDPDRTIKVPDLVTNMTVKSDLLKGQTDPGQPVPLAL